MRKDQPGEHRDVQPRDAHQMIDAGAREHLPVRLRDAGLVADRQRGQDAGIGRIAQRFPEMGAHRFAQSLHQIGRAGGLFRQYLVVALGIHIADGADVALQCPCLEIEVVRIAGAVRLLQAYGELPAFACTQFQRIVAVAVVSGELDVVRYMRTFRLHAFHIESETQAALVQTRHFGHDAGDRDILPLPFVRQRVGQTVLGHPCGIAETQQCGTEQ